MARPVLEVADIFRDHGPAWREANAGHLSLGQLKVMSAIESCRTAALGGHVARCQDCAHEVIAYNSCRDRHCPKCQGAAARKWLADREAELLPVPYYHVVFTLPASIGDIARQNKAVMYDLLFKASAETMITIAADPKHLGARIGVTSVLHTWGSALTHHPHVHMIVPGGGVSLDGENWVACRPGFFLPVRVLSRLFRRLFLEKLAAAHAAGRLHFFGERAGLADPAAFAQYLAPSRGRMGGLRQTPLRRSRGRARLSLALYPPRRHLQQPPADLRRSGRRVPLQRLPRRWPRTAKGHEADNRRVHPPLSHPCAATRLSPHSSLRSVGEQRARPKHRPRARVARRVDLRAIETSAPMKRSTRPRSRPSLPLLRRSHDRRREVPTRTRSARLFAL